MKTEDVLAIILAEGNGRMLFPGTKTEAKPAASPDGPYRLIDCALDNVIHSGMRNICVVPRYRSDSLGVHIQHNWNIFNPAIRIMLLSPRQNTEEMSWTGMASIVHRSLRHIKRTSPRYVLMLSANHPYKMDYSKMLYHHKSREADLTVGVIEVPLYDTRRFEILQVNEGYEVIDFLDKPTAVDPELFHGNGAFASVGIYIFNADVFIDVLKMESQEKTTDDSENGVVTSLLQSHRVCAYPFVLFYG